MIEINGVTQSYHQNTVLEDVNLQINKNELCALVGRNGAGKSTLIHTILGILPLKKGSIHLNGIPVQKQNWKNAVAYLPEKFQLYPNLTAYENMQFFASIDNKNHAKERLEDALKAVDLWEVRNERIKRFSKGMLQRLGLGIMLLYDTEILILDEPTSGLDPLGRMEILSILKSLKNKTILFSSHHMEEIRQICTHVAFVDNKKIIKHSIHEFEVEVLLRKVNEA
jgi:ABC-2 type transport system ATP-binding protein